MNETEAIKLLKPAWVVYQKINCIRDYQLNEKDVACLKNVKEVYYSGLLDDENVLRAAKLNITEVALLVGKMITIGLLERNHTSPSTLALT